MADNNGRRNEKIIKWLELTLDNKTLDLESTYSAMRIANRFLATHGLNARFRFGHGEPTYFDTNEDANPINCKKVKREAYDSLNEPCGSDMYVPAKKPAAKKANNNPFSDDIAYEERKRAKERKMAIRRSRCPFPAPLSDSSDDEHDGQDAKPYYGPPATSRRKLSVPESTSKSSKSSKPSNMEPVNSITSLLGQYFKFGNKKDRKDKEKRDSYDICDLNGPKKNVFKRKRDDNDDDDCSGSGFGLGMSAKRLRSNLAH